MQRKIGRHVSIRRSDALECGRTHMLGISLEVSQRGARSIRAAKEIELFISERGPDFVHIVDSDIGCVEFQIGFRFELWPALADLFERKEVTEITLEVVWIEEHAVERMGTAGAALVYEQQIAMLTDLCELRREADRVFS